MANFGPKVDQQSHIKSAFTNKALKLNFTVAACRLQKKRRKKRLHLIAEEFQAESTRKLCHQGTWAIQIAGYAIPFIGCPGSDPPPFMHQWKILSSFSFWGNGSSGTWWTQRDSGAEQGHSLERQARSSGHNMDVWPLRASLCERLKTSPESNSAHALTKVLRMRLWTEVPCRYVCMYKIYKCKKTSCIYIYACQRPTS